MIESNRTRRVQGFIHGTTMTSDKDISSIQGSIVPTKMNGLNRSRTSRSAISLFSPGHRSKSGMNSGTSFLNESTMNRNDRSGSKCGSERGGSVSATRTRADPHLDKFDFPCFVTFLIKVGPKVYPEINESQQAVRCFIEDFILPLYNSVNEMKQA